MSTYMDDYTMEECHRIADEADTWIAETIDYVNDELPRPCCEGCNNSNEELVSLYLLSEIASLVEYAGVAYRIRKESKQ